KSAFVGSGHRVQDLTGVLLVSVMGDLAGGDGFIEGDVGWRHALQRLWEFHHRQAFIGQHQAWDLKQAGVVGDGLEVIGPIEFPQECHHR
ncbi:hypothetical protein DKX15_17240, partial [Enterococcus faecium]